MIVSILPSNIPSFKHIPIIIRLHILVEIQIVRRLVQLHILMSGIVVGVYVQRSLVQGLLILPVLRIILHDQAEFLSNELSDNLEDVSIELLASMENILTILQHFQQDNHSLGIPVSSLQGMLIMGLRPLIIRYIEILTIIRSLR